MKKLVADLTPRIEKLVGRLAGGQGSGTERRAGGSQPALRPGNPGFAEAVARLVAMPLDRYPREGAPLEVRVPWHGETLWFVPDDRQAEALVREGVSRGRVWTAEELSHVMFAPPGIGDAVPTISIAKVALEGEVVAVEGRPPTRARGRRQEHGKPEAK